MTLVGADTREDLNRRLLRARDTIDRMYSQPLDIAALAHIALMSPAHFIRSFHATFAEPPHRYLQRRRIERAMSLLRHSNRGVSEICFEVGFSSVGTFGRTFREIVEMSPTQYRLNYRLSVDRHPNTPNCFVMAWTRPSSFGEAQPAEAPVALRHVL